MPLLLIFGGQQLVVRAMLGYNEIAPVFRNAEGERGIIPIAHADQIAVHFAGAFNENLSRRDETMWAMFCHLGGLFAIGLFLVIALFIFGLIVMVTAALRARDGEKYRYPLTIRFIQRRSISSY